MKPATITSSVVHALALISLPANAEIDETSINSSNNNKSKSEIVQNYNSGFNSFTTAETSFPAKYSYSHNKATYAHNEASQYCSDIYTQNSCCLRHKSSKPNQLVL